MLRTASRAVDLSGADRSGYNGIQNLQVGKRVSELELRDVVVDYERRDGTGVHAVDGVSLMVETGQFVSMVGPSGCGKTTLLKAVSGLLTPSAGSVQVGGMPVRLGGTDRAMVFQEAALLPWFSVERNIGYGLECQGVPRQEINRRVGPIIELVGLSGFEKHYPYELSGGMQQRANLARALVVDPRVLLMDEPFASLDAQTRDMMQAELLSVWEKTNKTVLFITHQISEAIYLSDRVIVLSARPGRVLADIEVDIARPRELAVKRTPEFLKYENQVWTFIEEQVRTSMAAASLAPADA
jgi:ABC-type nitrate/sulfonate/bicarbonate transport system ATPase subunit